MEKNSLIAGVIGGLGPAATIDFMQRVLELTPASGDQDHVRLLVDQNPTVPNRQHAILDGGPSPGPALAAMAVGLQRAGADFLVMPCNAAHAFRAEIVRAAAIPFVSIVDATIGAIPPNTSRIGVLETPACRQAGLYARALAAAHRNYLPLDSGECDQLMRVAYAIKEGERGELHRTTAKKLAAGLIERGAQAIVVACTEIPLILNADDVGAPLISTTDALARETIALAGGRKPLPDTAIVGGPSGPTALADGRKPLPDTRGH